MEPDGRLTTALSDRYAIESEIDSGGMATVYRARDLKHERTVAIKVLRPDLAEAIGADRFLREIRTTANLSHPHILPLFDSDEAYALAVERSEADPENPWALAWVGILAPFVGDTAQALEIDGRLAEWPREGVRRVFNFPWVRAQIHASLGDREGAVKLLEEVFYSGGESKIFSINDHITFELFPLRGYEPFEGLMRPKE